MNFSELCTPAMIYFAVSFIVLLTSSLMNFNVISLLIKGIFILLWSWVLNLLCKNGLTIISWVLVILPILGMSFTSF